MSLSQRYCGNLSERYYIDARDEKAHDNDAIDDHRPDDTAATPPTRVDTGLVARSQEDQELEQAAKMYDDNLSLVRRYFDVEPVEIELRSGTALTAEDIRSIWLEKKKYYDPSQSLEDVHRKITPAFVWSTVLIACAVTVSAGVTLNYEGGITGDSYVFIVVPFAGIILLLCYFLVHLSRFISRFAEAWDSLRDEQTVARIWNLVQKDVTQVDGTSATSSPAITASSVTRLSDTPTPPPEDIALQTISTHSS